MRGTKDKSTKDKWYEIIKIVEAQTDSGLMYYLVNDNYDFITLVKEYLNMIQARAEREVSPNTIKSYCYQLWYFIVFLRIKNLGILDLDGKPDILAQFKLWLKNPYRFYENIEVLNYDIEFDYIGDSLNVTTINGIISRVSALYLWLKASNKIKENPVIYRSVMVTQSMRDKDMLAHTRHNRTIQVNTLKSKVPKTIPKTVEQKDFRKFLYSVNLLRDKIILLCLKEGGFRSNELLGIHLEDIDFAEEGLWIRFRANNTNGSRAKAGYGRDRFVHLPTDLMALIDRYISSEWLESNADNDFLFVVVSSNTPSDNGQSMTKSTLDSMFKYYSKKTGIKIHPHMLRHTHATELAREYLSKGEQINWEYISKRLGHSNVTTTMEIYAHLRPEDYKKEYQRLQEYKNKKIKE
ncbi:tyrosine-type recombinase/integrase [Clostridium perfringens]|uniref:Site-specific recombinase, phage integrase family n=1 Tax=Clostridium perfringens TaxID=1502 RepID=A0A133N0Z4_CLOPF|nr:tyrosine-type recombinase/integrase [Clostridium perfringens]KXA09930.1 site-specific recombinase, phage integrase family [Clostridium perfringens]MBS5921483.1 tyrosine-type recombinase/integrase [Clostridium perfringens]